MRRPGELASSGRGLVLIELLADTWGVAPRGKGKSIWFELVEPQETHTPSGSHKPHKPHEPRHHEPYASSAEGGSDAYPPETSSSETGSPETS